MSKAIYLDNAATTFPKPEEVYVAMDNMNRCGAVNAGRGSYRLAKEASNLISETKTSLRGLVGVDSSVPVVFTSSITIALNQIISGLKVRENSFIYYSPYEHNAVARTLYLVAEKKNIFLRELPINENNGEIDIDKMKYLFGKEEPFAIFCTHISNVTGYILPVKEIFTEGKKYGCINVLDTAQSMGLISVDNKDLGQVDIIAFAGHKSLYGPLGIGGYINIGNIPLQKFIVGGTGSDSLNLNMPSGLEAGYEYSSTNIVAIAGLKAALDVLDVKRIYFHEKELTNYLVKKLDEISDVRLFIPKDNEKHIGIVSFALNGYKSDDVGMILDEDFGICVRTGYHCAPFIHKYLSDEKSLGTVRIGLSQFNTKEELDKLIEAIAEI